MQYLQKNVGDEADFLSADKYKSLYKLIVSPWECVTRHVRSTQNNNFAISLQNLKEKELSDENYKIQIHVMIFDGDGQVFPKFPK